jgi:hypothetical protein
MVNDEIEKKFKKNTKKHHGSTLVNSLNLKNISWDRDNLIKSKQKNDLSQLGLNYQTHDSS